MLFQRVARLTPSFRLLSTLRQGGWNAKAVNSNPGIAGPTRLDSTNSRRKQKAQTSKIFDNSWKAKEKGDEAKKVLEQRRPVVKASTPKSEGGAAADDTSQDYEGGSGDLHELEDRYATTCGEH